MQLLRSLLGTFRMPAFESRALKYGYANARVRGMRGLLLKDALLDELMRVGTIDGMVELLQRTPYRDDLLALALQYKGSYLIELAARRHFVKIVEKIKKLAPKSDLPVIVNLLRRWDFLNVKTILDAKRVGTSFDEIKQYIFAVGLLTLNDFERIAKSEPNTIIEEIRKTPLGKEIVSINRKKKRKLDEEALTKLHHDIDQQLYILIDRALSKGSPDVERIRKLFKREADAKNLAIIFRLKMHGVPKEKIKNHLLLGGTLSQSHVNQYLEVKDFSSALPLLKNTFKFISIDHITSLVDLEIELEKALAREKVAAFHRSILSIGVILGFLLLKEEEIHNVRKIAKGKEFAIPFDEIKKTLVTV